MKSNEQNIPNMCGITICDTLKSGEVNLWKLIGIQGLNLKWVLALSRYFRNWIQK